MKLRNIIKQGCVAGRFALGIVVVMSVILIGTKGQLVSDKTVPSKVLAADTITNPGSGLPEQPSEPQECINDEQQNSQDQQQSGSNQQVSQQRHDELVQQLNVLSQRMSDPSLSDDEKQSIQSQMDTIRTESTALEQQSSQQSQGSQPNEGTREPSAACKAAIVRSAQTNLGQYKDIINSRIIPTLNQVDGVCAAVEASIPHFREIGVSEDIITKINSDITTMRTSNTTLRSFFSNVITKIDAFLAKISDPNTAFDGMKNGFSVADQNSAVKAGDNLVAAFSDLQSIIANIKD
ncbi:MAG: hypothetical protein NUV85_02540 [Candidatus Berkelbacteria bacterium]|nr:hypothetical protein [Candidatus Berkelbacteria bacterium]